jgi:hypothetical protein
LFPPTGVSTDSITIVITRKHTTARQTVHHPITDPMRELRSLVYVLSKIPCAVAVGDVDKRRAFALEHLARAHRPNGRKGDTGVTADMLRPP